LAYLNVWNNSFKYVRTRELKLSVFCPNSHEKSFIQWTQKEKYERRKGPTGTLHRHPVAPDPQGPCSSSSLARLAHCSPLQPPRSSDPASSAVSTSPRGGVPALEFQAGMDTVEKIVEDFDLAMSAFSSGMRLR
jgi:hypothetical protein